jgi:transcriptional regulator with XRE-family HTH domain
MDPIWVGRSIRASRVRKEWTQQQLADAASVSRAFVSDLECGRARTVSVERLERVCRTLGAELDVRVRWRGEGLDRLLDESHADLVAETVRILQSAGWQTVVEATFSELGERGSVDVLGWMASTRALLIVEDKSIVADAQGTLMPIDRKVRLGPKIAEQFGWRPLTISRLLVLWDSRTNRRRIARVRPIFDTAFPLRGRAVRAWLKRPDIAMSGLLFVADATPAGTRRRATGRIAVRRRRTNPGAAR